MRRSATFWRVLAVASYLFLIAAFWAGAALGHPGGLDRNGGHRNSKTGEYHCHRAPCVCPAVRAGDARLVTIARAIDGDTLETTAGERVRLIGVDTPETVHPTRPVEYFGAEASAFTKAETVGKQVWLTFDRQPADGYGRTLAYVWVTEGAGTILLNERIIRRGYSVAYTEYPFRADYVANFREAERLAREERAGMWTE